MSGHSKWSKVKHQKATTDVVKSNAFTKATHAIAIAVKEGGGITDPNSNFHLRLAIEKARAVNMPNANIDRAIARAKGEGTGAVTQVIYEAYGPFGIAMLIEATTDNKQRTVAQIKNVVERAGGNLASPGAVSFQFQKRGVITVPKSNRSMDNMLEAGMDAGADDVVETGDMYEIYTNPALLFQVKSKLEAAGVGIDNAAIIMRPATPRAESDEVARKVGDLVTALEELDDVQTVYTNLV